MSVVLNEWYRSEDQLSAFGAELVSALGLALQPEESLQPKAPLQPEEGSTTVWLHGDMGMGKTTIVGHILRALGLPQGYPVNSPTFSLVNEYPISERYYAHLDLYRLSGAMDESLLDHREFAGVFIEWPTAVSDLAAIYPPDFHLVIDGNVDKRRYRLFGRGFQSEIRPQQP